MEVMSLTSTTTMPEYSDDIKCLSSVTIPLRVVVGTTCVFAMVGSFLIILSYFVVPGIRTKTREILVNLSLMDFMVACSNFVGVCINFSQHLGDENYDRYTHNYDGKWGILCTVQACFSEYACISSAIWTACIAVYIYLRVMTEEWISRRSVFSFYVIAYGFPTVVVLWQACTGKLGFDYHSGSSWCSTVMSSNGHWKPMNAVFANDIWVYMPTFLVIIVLISLHLHFKYEVKVRSILTRTAEAAVQTVEKKLLFIPVFFILMRVWSLVFIVVEVEMGIKTHCFLSAFFLFASGIGDSGQGFTNAILYVFATPRVRKYFLDLLLCRKRSLNNKTGTKSLQSEPQTFYSSITSEGGRREFSEEFTSSANLPERDAKSLLLNT